MNALERHHYELSQLTSVGLDAHYAKHHREVLNLVGPEAPGELYQEQFALMVANCHLCRPPFDVSWLQEENDES